MILDKIVDEAEYTAPDPTDNLDLAKELVLEYLAQGKRDKLEAENMEMLRTFNDQVDALKAKMAMAMMPPMDPMSAGAPQAAPMPSPVSDLLPNVMGA